jgi:hypothetical protein
MQLTELELVDLAEGTRPESSAPHLTSCDRCRQQLLEMRSLMSDAMGVEVPEPSPLFWDHFSARVRDAVAVERQAPRRWWHDVALRKRFLVPASAVALAALVIVSALTSRLLAPQPAGPRTAANNPAIAVGAAAPDDDFDVADDASLMLVADLSAEMNLDSATDDNLTPAGGAEHAVTHLNVDELRELQRLLQQELTPSGA